MIPPLKKNGILLMILASLFFSFMGAFVKDVTQRIPFMEAVFFRAFVSLCILTPWMAYKKIPFFGKNFKLLFLRSIAGCIALSLSFYVTSIIRLADASILNQTSVIFVALLSALFLNEKVSTPLIFYILCAFIGAALIIKPEWNVLNQPGLAGLGAGFFAAIAYVSIRELHKTDSFFTMVFNFSLFSSLIPLFISYSQFVFPTQREFILLIALGVCATLAQLLMTYSYKYADASVVSPYSFSGVIFSFVWGLIFWNELPDSWSILGMVLIIACGVGILKLKKSRNWA